MELILINGQPLAFSYQVQAGDRVAVYPAFAALELESAVLLRPPPPQPIRFLLDNHLGRLARYLRLLGLDTLYFNNEYDDDQLASKASEMGCVLLSRDRGLLKRSQVVHGTYLHSKDPRKQIVEVLQRYLLFDQIQPWSRCLRCNGVLQPVTKEQILERLEPKTKLYYDDFKMCESCRQIYWKGSHFKRLQYFVAQITALLPQ